MTDTFDRSPAPPGFEGERRGYFLVVPPRVEEDHLDPAAVLRFMVRSWKWAIGAAVVLGALAAVVSLQMPNIYRAEVLAAPVAQNGAGGASSLRNQFGGLAALAGIDLGSSSGRKEESIATLGSVGFAREFIVANKLLPVLFAERWDATAGKWFPGEKPPSLEDGVKRFTRDIRSVVEDRKTGLVSVTIEWKSPQLAAAWANSMVDMANERLRNEATSNSQRSIEYLNKELTKTNVVELHQAIYRLIEDQVNNAMLANVQREYAFRFIDRAVAPEQRISPKRTLMTAAGVLLGGILGLVLAFVAETFRRRDPAAV